MRETAEIYTDVVKPSYLDPMNMEHCNWIYSILNLEKELDLRVHESEGFLLQKDYEYNEGDLSTLYCLALPKQRDLKTVRDLTGEHLPLLRAIRDESLDAIEKKFSVSRNKILSFFHYQPTFYHLHVHFVHIDRATRDSNECVSLDQCIQNIEMMSDYYQRATLSYKVGTKSALFQILADKGILEPEPEPVEETKEEAKTEVKEDAKTEVQEEAKTEVQEEVKEEVKEEAKVEAEKNDSNPKDDEAGTTNAESESKEEKASESPSGDVEEAKEESGDATPATEQAETADTPDKPAAEDEK